MLASSLISDRSHELRSFKYCSADPPGQNVDAQEFNCLLSALRHVPGQTPKRVKAPNLRTNTGQHVMRNLGTITGGNSGESHRQHIARDSASAGFSTPKGQQQAHIPEAATRLLRNTRDSGFRHGY